MARRSQRATAWLPSSISSPVMDRMVEVSAVGGFATLAARLLLLSRRAAL